jgi:hypothetical protein
MKTSRSSHESRGGLRQKAAVSSCGLPDAAATPRRDPRGAQASPAPVLRACESAAARVKAASDELAASWSALCQQISTGVSTTDLLRKRAWCNVLELRLKEQAHALEEARHNVDAIWDDLVVGSRVSEWFTGLIEKNGAAAQPAAAGLPLLPRTTPAPSPRRAAALKK